MSGERRNEKRFWLRNRRIFFEMQEIAERVGIDNFLFYADIDAAYTRARTGDIRFCDAKGRSLVLEPYLQEEFIERDQLARRWVVFEQIERTVEKDVPDHCGIAHLLSAHRAVFIRSVQHLSTFL